MKNEGVSTVLERLSSNLIHMSMKTLSPMLAILASWGTKDMTKWTKTCMTDIKE